MLGSLLDVFRLRQYFDVLAHGREVLGDLGDDIGLLDDTRRALLPAPPGRPGPAPHPFPATHRYSLPGLRGRRLAVLATGGSGALASLVGAARALEEGGVKPAVISVCSGSALFGFPLAAGLSATAVAEFTLSLQPHSYVDVDWTTLATLIPKRARGFAGILRGEGIEAAYTRLLGDMRLGELAIPAYAPIWNIEHNRVEYLGPRTHPDVRVAHAVRMAVSLPLFIEPVALDGTHWCDGGIVDIFPVRPVLELEPPCDAALTINGFYPPGFAGEDATGWEQRAASILYVASQVRTCQQVELARANLARLQQAMEVVSIEPVPYETVRGAGFYRQFLSNRDWATFMQAGRAHTRRALGSIYGTADAHGTRSRRPARS